jgi:hypothetical protein
MDTNLKDMYKNIYIEDSCWHDIYNQLVNLEDYAARYFSRHINYSQRSLTVDHTISPCPPVG